jgi:hypothetical protein
MDEDRRVLFVCEHGSAKSVVAAAYFNRLVRKRQIDLRAVSRGTDPDPEVAPNVARGLAADGLEMDCEPPRRLFKADVAAAARVVTFGPRLEGYGGADVVEVWEDVPPLGEDYERARTAIVERVDRLLDELAEARSEAAGGLAS